MNMNFTITQAKRFRRVVRMTWKRMNLVKKNCQVTWNCRWDL